MRWMRGIPAAVAAIAALHGFSGEKEPAEIAAWVRQLGSEGFETREEAQKRLLAWCLEDPEPRLPRLPCETGDAESDAGLSRIRKAVQLEISRRGWQDADRRVPCARLVAIREDGLLICGIGSGQEILPDRLHLGFLVVREGKPIAHGEATEHRGKLLMLKITETLEGGPVRCGDEVAQVVDPRSLPTKKEERR